MPRRASSEGSSSIDAAASTQVSTQAPLPVVHLLALALLRILAAVVLLGMVHPDEFFQSQEVMARHVLQHDETVLQQQLWLPWEYELPTPNRSVLFPALVAGLPYQAMRWLGIKSTGFLLLVIPRLLLCGASFVIDVILYKLAVQQRQPHPLRVVVCFATAWPTLVVLPRPFSNSVEALVLALCMAELQLGDRYRRIVVLCGMSVHRQTLRLGALLALGVFTRFTFVCFFAPLALALASQQDALLRDRLRRKRRVQTTLQRIVALIAVALQGLCAFAGSSVLLLLLDTLYYRDNDAVIAAIRHFDLRALYALVVIAPLNNLLYNMNNDNLALHGTHARWTHAVVNVPLLFGPLAWQFVATQCVCPMVKGLQLRCASQWTSTNASYKKNSAAATTASTTTATALALAAVLIPLALLSLAPHQEPRFLLPLIVPLTLAAGAAVVATRARLLLWLVFNAALTLFFGVAHQGGVVPLLLALSSRESAALAVPLPARLLTSCVFEDHQVVRDVVSNVPLVFYKTYMPPRFLLAGIDATAGFQVVDLAGGSGSPDDVAKELQRIASSSVSSKARNPPPRATKTPSLQRTPTSATAYAHMLFVVPASVGIDSIVNNAVVHTSRRIGQCGPHISTEDIALDKPLTLELHLLEVELERGATTTTTMGDEATAN